MKNHFCFFVASVIQAFFLDHVQTSRSIKILRGSFVQNAIDIFKAKEGESFCLFDETLAGLIAPSALTIPPSLHVNTLFAKGLFSQPSVRKSHMV